MTANSLCRQLLAWAARNHWLADVAGLAGLQTLACGAVATVGNNVEHRAVHWVHSGSRAAVGIGGVSSRLYECCCGRCGYGNHGAAVVDVDAVIGEGAIVTTNTTVDYDASLGVFARLGVGVPLAGGVKIGARAWLQAGWSAGCQVVVGDAVVCTPGSVLLAEGVVAG